MNPSLSNRLIISTMIMISALILLFILWLIYLREPVEEDSSLKLSFLSPLNAVLNTLSAGCLTLGYWAIRNQKRELHKKLMLSAFGFSAVFLVSYLIYHAYQGDTYFQGEGWIRSLYFFILISHVVFSAVMLPLILITLYFALSGKLTLHPKVARFALPIWVYVSVTGVLVYLMLYHLPMYIHE